MNQLNMKKLSDLKILIISMQYGYGKPELGLSYDWLHFYLGLKPLLQQVDFFDYMALTQQYGQQGMQNELLARLKNTNYDAAVFILFEDQFINEFVRSLTQYTKTLGFFHDDNWRQAYVSKWAPCFNFFTTTDPNGVAKYAAAGLRHAIFVPFGVNQELFCRPITVKQDVDISFVGAWHPYREWLLKKIRKQGYHVEVFGENWPNGIIDEAGMIKLFQNSKISLNLSNSISYDIRYLFQSYKAIVNTLRSRKRYEQLKGRHFEIAACGAMQLSYYVEGLESLFQIGKEIAIYISPEDLLEKINYYLRDDVVRERVALAGYNRVLNEHTYGKRFAQVFKTMGIY